MVGLAAEHKGAWVIIDLTFMAEEKKSTFCKSFNLKLSQQKHVMQQKHQSLLSRSNDTVTQSRSDSIDPILTIYSLRTDCSLSEAGWIDGFTGVYTQNRLRLTTNRS